MKMVFFAAILLFATISLTLAYSQNDKNQLATICDNKNSLKYFIIDGLNKTGKTVLILGGIHGNEPAGSFAIEQLINEINTNKLKIKTGRLILVPYVNYCALQLNKRFVDSIGDMNRKFPTNLNDNNNSPTINKIIELVNSADFVIDFHEGYDYHRLNNKSIGSTISPNDTELSNTIASTMYDTINGNIGTDYKKYKIITSDQYLANKYPNKYSAKNNFIQGSLLNYARLIKKDYVLIETTGQNDIQPLNIRVDQDMQFINMILKYLNVI
jgi:hypothetical protein